MNRPWSAIEPDPPAPEPTEEPCFSNPENQGLDLSYDEGSQMMFGYWRADELNDLAWFLATCTDPTRRDGRRAVGMADLACKLTARETPQHLETLAAAHAECGDWNVAVATQREAISLLAGGDPSATEYPPGWNGMKRSNLFGLSAPKRSRAVNPGHLPLWEITFTPSEWYHRRCGTFPGRSRPFDYIKGQPPMRLPRVRFSVRTMMVVIADAAIMMGTAIEAVRLKRYRDRFSIAKQRTQAAKFGDNAAYHAALRQKYLRTSEAPWRSVEPDPPPPEPMARASYWDQRGDVLRSRAAWEEAIRDTPENTIALNNLAWSLSTCQDATLRDGKRGVELATSACTLSSRENPFYLDTLAAALAECGDFKAAIETQREAIGLLGKQNLEEKEYRARLERYEGKQPVREANQKSKSEQ